MEKHFNIHKNGFEHISNVFTEKSIQLLLKSILSIDLDFKMKYNIVEAEIIEKANNYEELLEIISHHKLNEQIQQESFYDHLRGENFNVNSDNRMVVQLCSDIDEVNKLPFFKIMKEKYNDTIVARVYDLDDINYKISMFLKNHKLIDNIISTNKTLFKYLHRYKFSFAKLFINNPMCMDQQIHCDEPLADSLILIIPLNSSSNTGTTILYDHEIVGKYSKNNVMKLGYLHDFTDEDMINDFKKAEYKKKFNIGDAILFSTKTFHCGQKNTSHNDSRMFLHILFDKVI